MNNNTTKKSLHLSFDSENLAVPEVHVAHETSVDAEEEVKESKVPKEVRDFFAADRYAVKLTGIEIEEASENYSRCSLRLTEDHRNLAGDVMGGALFTLADFSFAVATSRKHHYTITVTSEIRFLAKTKGDRLYSECRVIRDGGKICFADVTITDSTGAAVAVVSMSGMHLS